MGATAGAKLEKTMKICAERESREQRRKGRAQGGGARIDCVTYLEPK